MLGRKAAKGRNVGLHKIIINNFIKVYKLVNPRRMARGA
jgi:hypothetical protein